MGVKVAFLDADAASSSDPQPAGVLIPTAAVLGEGSGSFAWVLKGTKVNRRELQIGTELGDTVQVTAGLDAGERVVVSPPPELQDGDEVVVGS